MGLRYVYDNILSPILFHVKHLKKFERYKNYSAGAKIIAYNFAACQGFSATVHRLIDGRSLADFSCIITSIARQRIAR